MNVWLWASAAWYGFSGWLLPILLRLIGRLEVEHADRVPLEGPLVIVANHLNLIDPVLVCAVAPRRLRPIAKRELFETPLVGWILWVYGAFPVRRYSADIGALRAARNHLRNGDVVLMFPEATRSMDARLHPALPGAAMAALLARVPVVPVAITGTEQVSIPSVFFRWILRRRLHIRVEFGEPFALPHSPGTAEARHAEESTDLMMRRVAELLPESYRGAYGAGSEGKLVFARRPQQAAPDDER